MELTYAISNEVPKLGVFPSQEREIFSSSVIKGEKIRCGPYV